MRLPTPAVDDLRTAQSLQAAEIGVMTSFHQEHNADDTHKVIHASGAIYERARTVAAMGEWIPIIFMPSLFTGNGAMTWTVTSGSVVTLAYTLIGKTMVVFFDIQSSSVAGTPNSALQMTIPGGFIAKRTVDALYDLRDNATRRIGFMQVIAGSTLLSFQREDRANLTASATATDVQGQFMFEVQ